MSVADLEPVNRLRSPLPRLPEARRRPGRAGARVERVRMRRNQCRSRSSRSGECGVEAAVEPDEQPAAESKGVRRPARVGSRVRPYEIRVGGRHLHTAPSRHRREQHLPHVFGQSAERNTLVLGPFAVARDGNGNGCRHRRAGRGGRDGVAWVERGPYRFGGLDECTAGPRRSFERLYACCRVSVCRTEGSEVRILSGSPRYVARPDNERRSLHGAERAQPVAAGGKSRGRLNGSNRRKPLLA